jgi:PilZ domain
MGKRREPRKDIRVPVRVFGTDQSGRVFSEKVFTVNVSQHGAELSGLSVQLNPVETVGLTYGQTKGRFRVQWAGQPGSPEKPLWDFPLPGPTFDGTVQDRADRRGSPRMKATNSVEVYPEGQSSPIRARTADLSVSGCYVEMPNPLAKGTKLRIALWVKETKLWANARVITSTPGFGIGVEFVDMPEVDKAQLKQFLESITRIRL